MDNYPSDQFNKQQNVLIENAYLYDNLISGESLNFVRKGTCTAGLKLKTVDPVDDRLFVTTFRFQYVPENDYDYDASQIINNAIEKRIKGGSNKCGCNSESNLDKCTSSYNCTNVLERWFCEPDCGENCKNQEPDLKGEWKRFNIQCHQVIADCLTSKHDYPKDAPLLEYTGKVQTGAPFAGVRFGVKIDHPSVSSYGDVFISTLKQAGLCRWIKHSLTPTARFETWMTEKGPKLIVKANQPIKKGDIITVFFPQEDMKNYKDGIAFTQDKKYLGVASDEDKDKNRRYNATKQVRKAINSNNSSKRSSIIRKAAAQEKAPPKEPGLIQYISKIDEKCKNKKRMVESLKNKSTTYNYDHGKMTKHHDLRSGSMINEKVREGVFVRHADDFTGHDKTECNHPLPPEIDEFGEKNTGSSESEPMEYVQNVYEEDKEWRINKIYRNSHSQN